MSDVWVICVMHPGEGSEVEGEDGSSEKWNGGKEQRPSGGLSHALWKRWENSKSVIARCSTALRL